MKRIIQACVRRGGISSVVQQIGFNRVVSVIAVALCLDIGQAHAAERVLTPKLHHLRSGAVREWADFPEQAEAAELRLNFAAKANPAQQTLRLRHRDIKQTWKLRINDREIGRLPPDENDMVTFWAVPPNTLTD